MTPIVRLFALCMVLLVAGCASNRNGSGAAVDGLSGGAGAGMSGGVNDPTSVAYFQQSVGDRILFPVDESSLTAAARATLTEQARWLMNNASYSAVIEGHADEQGTREYNLALGARRASSVQDFLIAQGVSPNRIRTVTFGKERPIEVCSDEACYAQNRRAVTVLAGGGAGV
ncbi:peptidoglycan-associated lipoprotein Pal [Pseudoruegeria sp. SK021]|uniref:peptidoglycan-associated lipoprotein Pal n=1 Tax=Pseudoruegeria sp. SK021 TaxID=1933035 RepID=UPI000A25F717|nr:peptidoglycan-associated lipoprotein Pal [Pseudoruegeria sp. SK021]OSP56533.1 peptidoglycan-associated lipoprotein [Pseudoruegeria sp. SK021]